VCVPGQQSRYSSESTYDVKQRLGHLQGLHPHGAGGGAAGHTEQTEEQHEADVGTSAEHQHQNMDPRLQNTGGSVYTTGDARS